MDSVTEQLWITDIDTLSTAETRRFDTIISTCQDMAPENVSDDAQYLHFPLADDERSVINWGGRHDYELFYEAASAIEHQLQQGRTVLVHCHSGQNRSVATSIAAFGRHYEYGVMDSYDFIATARHEADPNDTMLTWASWYIDGVTPEDV